MRSLGRWVYSHMLWGSLTLSRGVGFTRVRPGIGWVHPWSLGSLAHAVGVVGFIRGRWAHSRAPWCLQDSSRVVEFTRIRLGGRWVHLHAPWEVVGISWCCWVHSRVCDLVIVGSIRGCLVHSRGPWGSLGSSGVVEFTRVHPGVFGFMRGRECNVGVVAFIWGRLFHSRADWRLLGSSGIVGFTCVHPGDGLVHPGSLGSLANALGVFGVMRGHWVHSRVPWGSIRLPRARPGGHCVYQG